MTFVCYGKLNRSEIMGAADETTRSIGGEVSEDAVKIRHLGRSKLFSYAGNSNCGAEVFDALRGEFSKSMPFMDYIDLSARVFKKTRSAYKASDVKRCKTDDERATVEKAYSNENEDIGLIFNLDIMLAGFDPTIGEFKIYYVGGSGEKKSAPNRIGCIGYSDAVIKGVSVLKEYLEKFRGENVPREVFARALLDATDQARKIDLGGDGKAAGSTQLIIVDSHGKSTEFSRDKTNFLTRTIRQNRKKVPGVDDKYMENAFGDIILKGIQPKNFWDKLPAKVRNEIGFYTSTDMTL